MTLSVKGAREMEKSFRRLALAAQKAENRAVARVGTTIKAVQSREIAKLVNVRVGTIKDEIVIKQKPASDSAKVVFEVRERGIPLKDFPGTRQTRKGLAVKVMKGEGRKVLTAGFGVRDGGMKGSGAPKLGGHFFGRVGRGSREYGSPHVSRLPIKKLYGPSVLGQYIKDAIQVAGVTTWNRELPAALDRELAFYMKREGFI